MSDQLPGLRGVASSGNPVHGALTPVAQTFRSYFVVPPADWSSMSTPVLPGTPTETWTGGFPIATFPRITVSVAGAPTMIPLMLPIAVFSSTRLLLPLRIPMPKFEFAGAVA
jgi:hypothetical protein